MTTATPRYGVLSHCQSEGNQAPEATYRAIIELASAAERDGFEEFWIAQHHFSSGSGVVPSPLVVLAHVGALASTLTLGTAVIALPFEDPIRLAEDLATLRTLLGRPIHVGLSSGNPTARFEVFGIAAEERHEVFNSKFEQLRSLLAGRSVLPGEEVSLSPAPQDLGQELYRATSSPVSAAQTAAEGLGLLLSFSRAGATADDDRNIVEIQSDLISAYDSALPPSAPGRLATARAVFVTDDEVERQGAYEHALALLRRYRQVGPTQASDPTISRGATVQDQAEFWGLVAGPSAYVQERLLADPVVQRADLVLFQTMPLVDEFERTIESNRRLAEEVLVGPLSRATSSLSRR